jgi:hypothetical protein
MNVILELGRETDSSVVNDIEKYIECFPEMEEILIEGDEDRGYGNQAERILEILTLDVSYYILRRIGGICGSHIDRIMNIRRELINSYENKYGYPYQDPNKNVDW